MLQLALEQSKGEKSYQKNYYLQWHSGKTLAATYQC